MTEEEVLKRIRDGGKAADAAVRSMYELLAQPMLRFFVHHGISGDEAKDVLQEAFIKVVRNAASYKGDGTAKSWIWQIARNCLTDHFRKQSTVAEHEITVNDEQWHVLNETKAAPEICTNARSVDECVAARLHEFAKQMPERAYVLTLQLDGLSIDEIGRQIGRTTAAAKEFLSQCRKRIQPFIAHCTELLTS
jgi:RNA polymerase sigma factor (sigma-70 family)